MRPVLRDNSLRLAVNLSDEESFILDHLPFNLEVYTERAGRGVATAHY